MEMKHRMCELQTKLFLRVAGLGLCIVTQSTCLLAPLVNQLLHILHASGEVMHRRTVAEAHVGDANAFFNVLHPTRVNIKEDTRNASARQSE